jgi:DNA-binding NarL/FixJ family response regulator
MEVTVPAIKVLIVDDNGLFRRRITELLVPEPDIEIVGEAGDGREAIRRAGELTPDVVLMDVRMAGMSGLTATRQIKDRLPQVRVIILSRFDLQEYRDAALAYGASAYVVKESLLDELLPAIRAVPAGKGVVPRRR